MSAAASFEVSVSAYCKTILHCAKYPWREVSGVWLGQMERNDGSSPAKYTVVDAVPLFHCDTLAPMTEAALNIVEELCKSWAPWKGLEIVGYYYANEGASDVAPKPLTKQVASKIGSIYPSSRLFMINGAEISDPSKTCLVMYARKSKQETEKWTEAGSGEGTLSVAEGGAASLTKLLKQEGQKDLIDFDDHFDDPSKDFRNLGILR